MKYMIITSSPNVEGITASCGKRFLEEIEKTGSEGEIVCLNDYKIGKCCACGNAWGTCLADHECQIEDDFQSIHHKVQTADGYIVVTPVYFWDMSEAAKVFFDRLRRCEFKNTIMNNKPVVFVACAGGSGSGTDTCIESMKLYSRFMKLEVVETVEITRANKESKFGEIGDVVDQMLKFTKEN